MSKNYDPLLYRLTSILTQLSSGLQPTMKELAEEFNVSIRTIQRDVYTRLGRFPIIVNQNKKLQFIAGFTLNRARLDAEEIMTMTLSLELIKNKGTEFSKASTKLMDKFLYQDIFNPYYIKPVPSEQIDTDSKLLNTIEDAIERKNSLHVKLKSNNFSILNPIKIINFDGFWYLLSKKEEKFYIEMLSNIKEVKVLNEKFDFSEEEKSLLENIHTPFFERNNSFEVKIKVTKNIAHYFKLKKFLPSQKIEEEYEDGSIVLTYQVSHLEEVDNLIKSYFPDIVVLEPKEYKDKILDELKKYIEKN